MAKKEYAKGEESILYIKYNDDWVPISCEISSPMSEDVETIGTTTRDNMGWRTYLPTVQGYSLSVSALMVKENTPDMLSYWRLKEIKRSKELVSWKRETMNGYYIDSGNAYITSLSDTNEVGEFVGFEMTLLGNGRPISQPPFDLVKHNENDEDIVKYTDGDNFVKYD